MRNNTGNKIVWTPERRLEWGRMMRAAYTPEWRSKLSKARKEGLASGKIKLVRPSPEAMKRMAEKLSLQRKGKYLRNTLPSDSEKRKAAERARATRGPGNPNEKSWSLRSPTSQVFIFRNLSHFIRTNPNLFDPEDLVVIGHKSRAARGIQSLSPRLNKNSGSWKGWTWYSHLEEIKNNGRDLLNREISVDT